MAQTVNVEELAGAVLRVLHIQYMSNVPFGITVDETTDVAVEKQLIVYIKVAGESLFMGLVNVLSEPVIIC